MSTGTVAGGRSEWRREEEESQLPGTEHEGTMKKATRRTDERKHDAFVCRKHRRSHTSDFDVILTTCRYQFMMRCVVQTGKNVHSQEFLPTSLPSARPFPTSPA